MAHKFKIEPRPHINKDGSPSESKKDYVVTERGRRGSREVGVATSHKRAEELIKSERERLIAAHIAKHPNDEMFTRKHQIGETK